MSRTFGGKSRCKSIESDAHEAMKLSAIDSFHRGLVNLRANWELILVQWLQIFVVAVLVVVGFLPPLAILGFGDLDLIESSAEDWMSIMDSASDLVARGRDAWVLLLAALVLSCAIWFMATLVYCYFQAGIYGVFMAGDRQAPPGRPRGRQWFRTFSIRNLRGWAARYLWRYFWMLNLFLLLGTVWFIVPVVLMMLVVYGEARWGMSAALGIGCGGAIPVLFSMFVLAFWLGLAQAELAREESSVLQATKRGLRVLGRRLGAVILVAVAVIVASFSMTIAMFVVSTFVQLPIQAGLLLQIGWQVLLSFVQWALGGVIGLAYISILIALVRSEDPPRVSA